MVVLLVTNPFFSLEDQSANHTNFLSPLLVNYRHADLSSGVLIFLPNFLCDLLSCVLIVVF
jgi:hypothetical protein